MNGCFAYYRLPGENEYVEVSSSAPATVLKDISEAGNAPGFIIAPFSASSSTAIVLIPAQELCRHKLTDEMESEPDCIHSSQTTNDSDSINISEPAADKEPHSYAEDFSEYGKAFASFHQAVCDGRFRKLVLSRSRGIEFEEPVCLKDLFLKACAMYPHLMVMLHHTDISGTWLVATPEPLIEYHNGEFHTVALAGTINGGSLESSADDHGLNIWDAKNRAEQNVVERFITESLEPFASEIWKEGPYTSKAGHLLHLKTDIHFKASESKLGEIVSALHPTPAICGLPQKEAREFILRNEAHRRKYYSGFAGPVGINGRTRLYVSLRCAEFPELIGNGNGADSLYVNRARLYAGGGIMPDSACRSEFEETENKMQTMKRCLDLCQIRKEIENVQQYGERKYTYCFAHQAWC